MPLLPKVLRMVLIKVKKDKKDKKKEKPAAEAKPEAAEEEKHHKGVSQVSAAVERARSGVDEVPEGYERPVIIHRAILGSVERFFAVLIEHTGGKWPFWLSPRQICVVPVSQQNIPYAKEVGNAIHAEGFYVDVDASRNTLNKKVREAQLAQYNFILVVGAQEQESNSVNIRTRDNVQHGTKTIADTIAMLKDLNDRYQ